MALGRIRSICGVKLQEESDSEDGSLSGNMLDT